MTGGMPLDNLEAWFAMTATMAFAVTAVLAVADRGVDVFGTTVLGIITAVGGGTVRDLILDVPVFWAVDLRYIWVAIGASLAAFAARAWLSQSSVYGLMLLLDGFGAALFGIQAAGKVWDLEFGLPIAPIILGVVTAIGGGLIRDVLAGRQTLLMTRELYAIPVMLGCIGFVAILDHVPDHRMIGSVVCILFVAGLRAAAIRWRLAVPHWLTTRPGRL
jgi:uncharacterized membrane protein YeiH